MSALFPPSFYRKPFLGFGSKAALGPFPSEGPTVSPNAGVILNVSRPLLASQGANDHGGQAIRNVYLLEGALRGRAFPGVLKVERPATGTIDFPAKAAITDHSTLTFADGGTAGGDPVVFEFKKVGAITPGNVEVDISAATTPTEVAGAFVASMNAWDFALNDPPSGFFAKFSGLAAGPGGLLATPTIVVVQASTPKNYNGLANGDHPDKLTWFGKTWGSLANNAIVASVPGEWTGRITGMSGGKYRRPGVFAMFGEGAKRLLTLPGYVPALKPNE